MSNLLKQSVIALRQALQRRGGGLKAAKAVLIRGYKVFRALGFKGLTRRIRGSSERNSAPAAAFDDSFPFTLPTPVDAITLKVGVMAHVFYADLLGEFREQLSAIPIAFSLFVSVVSEADRQSAILEFSKISNLSSLVVRIVPNRGRDLAPMLVTFREEVLALDLVCHIHTKKSLYTGNEQERWRKYLLRSLLGSEMRAGWIIGMFQATPELGMVYPESFEAVPLSAHTWLSNREHAQNLCDALDISIDPNAYIDFAAGSMFWARVDALRPIYDLKLGIQDFPPEAGQTDGTIQHALERVLAQLVKSRNMVLGIMPSNLAMTMNVEGQRNWQEYFHLPVQERITIASIDASIVSLDLFETLVVRSFLTAGGARTYIEWLVERSAGLQNYATLREKAEIKAGLELGRDPDNAAIYRALAEIARISPAQADLIRQLELEAERRMLAPRREVVTAAKRIMASGKSVIGISDMYLSTKELVSVLPTQVVNTLKKLYVSCETGWRKDTNELWCRLPGQLSIEPKSWLHVGDNEHSDIQLPYDDGFIPPVHTLRPSALLDVVPALRPLRLSRVQMSHWPNQLSSGLICNRFAELADTYPHAFRDTLLLDDPETLGYVVFGPIILDYLNWLARLARSESTNIILFLSREGYLLERAFAKIQGSTGSTSFRRVYLLASRRGTGTPTLRKLDDIKHLLGGTYTGTLFELLKSRTGDEIAQAAWVSLGDQVLSREVYLPEMREAIIDTLRPLEPKILEIAERERDAYLTYWAKEVGTDRAIVADVGYAGTIQSHLGRLTGQALGGGYLALDHRSGTTIEKGQWARARYHDHREGNGNASFILANDLLFEAVLTAPEGQFSHFIVDGNDLRAVYRNETRPDFGVVSRVQAGVLKFVDDACMVVGTDAMELQFDPALVQQPLSCLNKKLWTLGAWSSGLVLDDDFTGRGHVEVAP